jgi:hypothetical protein
MKKLVISAVVALVVLLAAAPAAAGDATVCESTFEAPFTGEADDLIVKTGTLCVLVGAHVQGDVLAQPGSDLQIGPGTQIDGDVEVKRGANTAAFQATIGGSYECDHCVFEDVVESSVGRNVEVEGAAEGDFILLSTIGGNLHIEESAVGNFAFAVLGNQISGNVKIEENTGAMGVEGNTIGGNLVIAENEITESLCAPEDCPPFGNGHFDGNNVGGNMRVVENSGLQASISDNTIAARLVCRENEPAPSGGGNTAATKEGQCRSF